MPLSDQPEPDRLHQESTFRTRNPANGRWRSCLLSLLVSAFPVLNGCSDEPTADDAADAANEPLSASFLPANIAARAGCTDQGLLQATVYGALSGDLDWSSKSMDCEGMPRPDGNGARLRFAGIAGANAARLAIIISLPGLPRAEPAAEIPSNITIIEEGSGRFFSTNDLDNCWTDIERQYEIDSAVGRYSIDGTLYCISPLAEVNGPSSVSITKLRFSGLVDWGAE